MSLMLDAEEQLLRKDVGLFVQGPLRVRPGGWRCSRNLGVHGGGSGK